MGTQIGAGWTKNTGEGKTYISFVINNEVLNLIPQLKGMNLTAFHVAAEDRKNKNFPGWQLVLSEPKEPKTKQADAEEIPL